MARRQLRGNVTLPDHIMHNSKLNYKQNFAVHPAFSLVADPPTLAFATLKHSTGTPA